MSSNNLSTRALRDILAIRDLTDPDDGPHAMQEILALLISSLESTRAGITRIHRENPIVSVADNYDRLNYPPGAAVRDRKHTRYVCETALLRTQTTSMIPGLLRQLAREETPEVLLVCPGLVYRRDAIDRLHTGEPHQVDLWRIRRHVPLGVHDLEEMVRLITTSVLPGRAVRLVPVSHPYTTGGMQIDVAAGEGWVEIGECGLALPELLEGAGLPVPGTSGLAMGLGLDRLLMLRKGIGDIRLLRSTDPRISAQMLDISPYREISTMPAVRRDLSLVMDGPTSDEELGDSIRSGLGDSAGIVEGVSLIEQVPSGDLAPAVTERLGIAPGQWNVVIRVTLRAVDRTLTRPECDLVRDRIYRHLHRGARWYWAASPPADPA